MEKTTVKKVRVTMEFTPNAGFPADDLGALAENLAGALGKVKSNDLFMKLKALDDHKDKKVLKTIHAAYDREIQVVEDCIKSLKCEVIDV